MLVAGIAWNAQGFDVAFLDTSRGAGPPPRRFAAGRLAELTDHLCQLGGVAANELVCVVESTDGMVDGGLMARGLRLYRADPWQLPERPALGSVAADTLAQIGVERLPELTLLIPAEGSLTGRDADHARHAEESADILAAMTAGGRCLVRGGDDPDDPCVALTFDDGPHPPYTGRILDILDAYAVPATFFCVGLHAAGHLEELARMRKSGHRVGNHTWSHPFLPDLSSAELEEQLQRTDDALEAGVGPAPGRLFRPPYGSGTPEVFARLRDDPATTVVLWGVDTIDWAMPGADAIASSASDQARPGSIVLMHDGGGDRSQTVEALPAIIENLLGRGLRLVTVDELPG
jgi:peptidoglycan/xylan/chitin deacetylase (PgdA/CDA1 family)